MRLMTFIDLSFHEGRNCTIRRGRFWSCLKVGEEIGLVKSLMNSKERIVAEVEEVRTLRYRELKGIELKEHHISHYKGKKEELLEEMKRIHKGRKEVFSANETVTVVFFRVKGKAYVDSYGELKVFRDKE